MDDGMDSDIRAAKKKLALLIASGITVVIFLGWIFYFVGSAKNELAKSDDPFALFTAIKENTGNAWGKIGNVFTEMQTRIASTTAAYQATATPSDAMSTTSSQTSTTTIETATSTNE